MSYASKHHRISIGHTKTSKHQANAPDFAPQRPTAYLDNTARGRIVDQTALTEVLQAGRIAGAGLDVLEQEPPEVDEPLMAFNNVIVTPHALCWTDQLFAGSGAADVLAVRSGNIPTGIVNREFVDRPGWRARLSGYAQGFRGG